MSYKHASLVIALLAAIVFVPGSQNTAAPLVDRGTSVPQILPHSIVAHRSAEH